MGFLEVGKRIQKFSQSLRSNKGWVFEMALLRKWFHRKPPDGLLDISDRVFGMCFYVWFWCSVHLEWEREGLAWFCCVFTFGFVIFVLFVVLIWADLGGISERDCFLEISDRVFGVFSCLIVVFLVHLRWKRRWFCLFLLYLYICVYVIFVCVLFDYCFNLNLFGRSFWLVLWSLIGFWVCFDVLFI